MTHINQKLLQKLDLSYLELELKNLGLEKIDQKFFAGMKQNITFLSEMKTWWQICKSEFRYANKSEDKEFLKMASKLLPQDTANENCWNIWLSEIKKNTERKGKDLFMPIRLALTGQEHGPELKLLVNLIAREEILGRLES